MKMKMAYFGIPHVGGTHTVFVSLLHGLAEHGIEVSWFGAGERAASALHDPAWAGFRNCGTAIHLAGGSDRQHAETAASVLQRDRYDGVLVNVLASPLLTNVVRFLPKEILRIMIVHNITPGTYAAARSVREWVHTSIGVSPRIVEDLCQRHGFAAENTVAIANAINLAPFENQPPLSSDRPLRLLSLGRLDESAKGVLWLPEIMRRLTDLDVRLTIAGDGPARQKLAEACRPMGERIRLIGPLVPADVPALMASHHVFLLPSRYEGFGQTLVEAMASGCVPVASRIRGVTDTIIDDGGDGLLFPVGDTAAAAAAIRRLVIDPAMLVALAQAARVHIRGRFDLSAQAAAYAEVIRRITSAPPPIADPLPFERWSYPRGLRPGLRTYLPEPVKNLLRTWKERFAA